MTRPAGTVAEVAAWWAMRLGEDPSAQDRAAFEAWVGENPAHADAYARATRGLSGVGDKLDDPRLAALGARVLADTAPRRRRAPLWAAGLAACLALVVAASALVATGVFTRTPDAYETAIGERSTVRLADGSTVTLNTASRIEIDYSPGTRGVTLARGQALFEVAKDADRPFVVTAGDRTVTALGTAFDVRLDAARVQVTLIEGKVSVDEKSAPAAKPAPTVLAPGEQLVAAIRKPDLSSTLSSEALAKEEPEIITTDVERVTSWREGRLVFRNEPLADAVTEVNRYSTTKLLLADDPHLQEVRVSGVFDTGSTASFTLALETLHGVHVETLSSRAVALTWREPG